MYKLREEKERPKGKAELLWDKAAADNAWIDRIVLLDEVSMINEEIAKDIRSTGAVIIGCGDPGQLPPVKGNPFFNRADITLQTIHRQALNSPIIRQAHNMRAYGYYTADGDNFQVVNHVPREEILLADVILTWKNDTRHQLNALKRAHLNIERSPPLATEPVMCLMNNRELGMFNGATYELAEDYVPFSNTIYVNVDGVKVEVYNTFFEGVDDQNRRFNRQTTPFCYGYATTVHKAQGSEYKNVILADEYAMRDGYREWAYTAITRAADRILVQRGHN